MEQMPSTSTSGTDRDALIERLGDLAVATDRREWDTVRSIFAPDARAYGVSGGPDAILAQMHAFLDGVGATQHLLGNHRVTVDGDTARTLAYGRVYHVGAGPMEGSFYECLGDYDDRWVRTDQGWLLRERRFDIQISLGDFAVLRPA